MCHKRMVAADSALSSGSGRLPLHIPVCGLEEAEQTLSRPPIVIWGLQFFFLNNNNEVAFLGPLADVSFFSRTVLPL
jgi:hypothetical protein